MEAIDRKLRDIRNSLSLMGGVTVVLTRDFRHIFPVIPKRTRADDIRAYLKFTRLWQHVKAIK